MLDLFIYFFLASGFKPTDETEKGGKMKEMLLSVLWNNEHNKW